MKVVEFNARSLALCHGEFSSEVESFIDQEDFVALLPAYSAEELALSLGFAQTLIERGCREFCSVGSLAGEMEDELDEILERRDKGSVLTVSFSDDAEAVEYFLFAADGGQAKRLVAAVGDHTDLKRHLASLTGNRSLAGDG